MICLRSLCLLGFLSFLLASAGPSFADDPNPRVSRIAFGSCANQHKPCPIWKSVADYDPDLLLLIGDNVYADLLNGRLVPATPERIAEAYEQLASHPDFARLRQQTTVMAVWDDHDYGKNDAGADWELKDQSAAILHDFLQTPMDSPRRKQSGVYQSEVFGPTGQRVQVILLDTRYFRSPLPQASQPMPGWRSRPYLPQSGPGITLLGDEQWKWLEEQLRQPAEIRIIGSSIQVISDEHPFEMWGNFPEERNRLYQLIRETGADGVVLISGDRHLGDISMDATAIGYPLFDVTASGLNQAHSSWRPMEPNNRRVAGLQYGNHFGSIEIDWNHSEPEIRLQLRHEDGQIAVQSKVLLSLLQSPYNEPPLPEGVSGPAKALALPPESDVTVQFKVATGREFSNAGRILLNSLSDFRSTDNLTVVVNRSALVGQHQNVTLDKYHGKVIRVKGKISLYNGQKQIVVDSAEQLEIID